jgi:hypothetical protein
VDRRESLQGIPAVNDGVTADEESGRVVLTVQFPRGRGLLARFQPPVLERRVKLDEVGSFVFRLIDNQRTTWGIIEAFMARYRTNRREATLSVVEFLKSLAVRGVISILIR